MGNIQIWRYVFWFLFCICKSPD